ncbi:hypothetical protein Tco_0664852 [Tanacetum coccineum]
MKVRKEKRSDHLVDEEDKEDQPASEPQVEDDEYNLQSGIQMSLESFQAHVSGVAIREPDLGIIQKLPEVEGKGKGIVSDEQAAQSLLDLQKPKKKSTMDQYIFQRRTPATQDTSTGPFVQPQDDTSANVVRDTPSPADAKTGADTEKSNSEMNTEILYVEEEHGEEVSNMVALEERTVELDEGQAGSDPGKTPEYRPLPERVLMEEDQAGSNPGQSHVVQAGPNPEPMHKDFVATVYPQVHESLKHTTEEHVLIENPPSSTRTLSSMKNIEGTFTFGDQFLNDKPTKEEPGKAKMETKDESMVTVPIYHASSSVPPLSTLIIDLTPPKPMSPRAQEPIFTATTATTTTTFPLPPPPRQQSTTDPDLANHVFALEKRSTDFKEKHRLQDKKTTALAFRVYNLENHNLYSKIEKQVNERRHDDQDPPPPPPKDSDRRKKKRQDFDASALKQPLVHKSSAWKTSDIREAPSRSSKQKPASPPLVDDNPILNNMYLSDSEDTGTAHLPKIKTRPDWLKPLQEKEAPETPKPDWVIPLNDLPKTENNWADALAKTYKDPKENKLLRKTRDMGSFINWYCKQIGKSKLVKDDLEGPAYKLVKPFHKSSISLHFQREECHFLLTKQINLMNPKGNRVVHDINKPLPLGGTPCQIRNIVIRQCVEDLQLDIESYQMKLNLTQPRWDATDFLFKEDYTIVHKPWAVIYRDRNDQKKMMRESEVHKFSDGTLTRILEKLDFMVKDYELFKFNPGMERRI